jgi:hypothetical protein
MKYLLSLAAVAYLALTANAATDLDGAAKDIVGAWKLDFTTPDDVQRTPLVVVGRQHQELVAWYVENETPQAFQTVSLQDDALSLTIRPQQRPDVTVTLEARLDGDGVCSGTGTFVADDGDMGSWTFRGRRAAMSEFGNVDTWSLSFVTPDNQQHQATVAVVSKDDQVYAWYSSEKYELPAKMNTDGDQVVMSMATTTQTGEKVDVTFRGTVTGDRVAGEAEYDLEGEKGTFLFRGARK